MEVHVAMSASRITTICSGKILFPRLAFCILLAALCLLTFPRKSAQTSSFSGSTQAGGEVSTLRRDKTAERIANLSNRVELTRLPEPGGNAGCSAIDGDGGFRRKRSSGSGCWIRFAGEFRRDFLSRRCRIRFTPDTPGARQRKANRGSNISAALTPAESFSLSAAPDFLVAGDFDFDGHLDLAAATKGGDTLYVLNGDGKGNFALAKRIDLGGRVTALIASNLAETGNVDEIAVGIVDKTGPAVILLRKRDTWP
jgi:hypothetical protein